MDLSKAIEWINQEKVSLARAIILSRVPIDVKEETITKVLDTVKFFGNPKICGRRGDSTGTQLFLLLEASRDLDPNTVPPEVGIDGEAGPWAVHVEETLVTSEAVPVEDVFRTKLLSLLQTEGKSMEDFRAIASESQPPKADVNMDLVHAIGKLVDKCNQVSADGPSYRKLRLFSGLKPVSPGEEEYDAWMEQATQMISEWQCNDAAKRQRIVESLKGPAADIVRFLKVSIPNATATDYLSALDTAYGTTESGADLLATFRHTYQNEREKLSAFLYRLDKLLHRTLLKGGIRAEDMDRARIEQLVKGALTHDMVALRIRLSHTLATPPSFSQLMRDVREEENWISAREGVRTTAAVATAAVTQTSVASELNSLRDDVKELSSQVTRLLNVAPVAPTTPERLMAMAGPVTQPPEVAARDAVSRVRTSRPPQPGIFCYQCGEDGHTKRECQQPEDLRKVIQKLIKGSRQQGNFPGAR